MNDNRLHNEESHTGDPSRNQSDVKSDHRANRLVSEKSPYLLQHASNPVDWYPWSDEAFTRARTEDRPIFLSIGYSTCHWCHVMEHESFVDDEVAAILNEHFIAIKVDREERPDIDNIYMTACQLLTGRGGWPLTIIMTPDAEPFFAATYIPKESRFGMRGLLDLLPQIAGIWKNDRDKITKSTEQIVAALRDSGQARSESPEPSLLDSAYRGFAGSFDSHYGGFGQAPKFPSPHNMSFLLWYGRKRRDQNAEAMVYKTLDAMRLGGMYDHLGYGFHRYSTDATWLVPHFEKMLYDQAMLVMAYTDAFQASGDQWYADIVHEILTYVQRDMTDPEGGFYSAEDADSEGEEGKFYVWTISELEKSLPDDLAALAKTVFNFRNRGNFRDEISDHESGRNILHLTDRLPKLGKKLGLTVESLTEQIDSIRTTLLRERGTRIPPLKDTKVLADWNGLMIAAFAKAGRTLNDQNLVNTAVRAVSFLEKKMTVHGHLVHRYRDGDVRPESFLDDYAFVAWGLLELYQASHDPQWLKKAITMTETMTSLFHDPEGGGFFMTPPEAEQLLIRTKEFYDGALPSGNSVAYLVLTTLFQMTGRIDFRTSADELARAISGVAKRSPQGFTMFLHALDRSMGPSWEVVIVGNPKAEETSQAITAFNAVFAPSMVLMLKDPNADSELLTGMAPFTAAQQLIDGTTTFYVCSGQDCRVPTTNLESALETITAGT